MSTTATAAVTRWGVRRQVVVFLLITVLASWWPWPLTLLNPSSTPLVPVGPTVAAVVVAALAGGRRQVRALLGQLARRRVHLGWYAVALLGPGALIGSAVLVTVALGGRVDPSVALPGWQVLPLLFLVRTVIGGALGEELGWRGFLLPLLLRRHGALVASLLVAVPWFAFHLPTFLAGPSTAQRPPLLFLLWIVPVSVLHTWLFLRSGGSVLIVTLFHGMIDTAASLLLPLFSGADYRLVWVVLVGVASACAAVVALRDPSFRRGRHPHDLTRRRR